MTNMVPSPIKVTLQLPHMKEPYPLSRYDVIADFRGDPWFFDSVARLPIGDGRSGKVFMLPADPNHLGDIPHPSKLRVFNIGVFPGLEVTVDADAQQAVRSKVLDHITKSAHRTAEEHHNG